jgi:hypothetical protein
MDSSRSESTFISSNPACALLFRVENTTRKLVRFQFRWRAEGVVLCRHPEVSESDNAGTSRDFPQRER